VNSSHTLHAYPPTYCLLRLLPLRSRAGQFGAARTLGLKRVQFGVTQRLRDAQQAATAHPAIAGPPELNGLLGLLQGLSQRQSGGRQSMSMWGHRPSGAMKWRSSLHAKRAATVPAPAPQYHCSVMPVARARLRGLSKMWTSPDIHWLHAQL
jgi:hypothetical protein